MQAASHAVSSHAFKTIGMNRESGVRFKFTLGFAETKLFLYRLKASDCRGFCIMFE